MLLPKKNEEFLKTLLKSKEGISMDFKQSITSAQKIAKTLVAFSNSEGGTLVIGVSDKRLIIGIDPEEEIFMIEKAAREFCDPPIHSLQYEILENIEIDQNKIEIEKMVLLVHVKKSNQLHYFKNHNGDKVIYLRNGDQTLPQS
ncbi:helix-turn-helix domain-containing protein [Aquiflexum gelatinilyticum]|uniref:AlbA family DNA-binding domain-containing protein n=1 Tax=Aquiflexum gelatinilyticum TaxID=2961943 RepID=UPI00216773E0|nr:ATP-binding protein [Aquiflexum gelatinilyticum]MCS4436258.1 ATP-binding protein [Aquiflexum gelatinilyticum]